MPPFIKLKAGHGKINLESLIEGFDSNLKCSYSFRPFAVAPAFATAKETANIEFAPSLALDHPY